MYLAWPFHPNSTLSVPQLNLPRSSRGYVAATFDKVHQAGRVMDFISPPGFLFLGPILSKKTTYPWNNPSIPKAQNWAGRNSYSIWVWGMFQVYVEKILYINALTIDSAMTVCLPERFSFSTHSIHLRLVLHTILCLFPDSLCLLGPCCSSWGIPCRYTTMRSYINANGATHLPFVAEANQTIGLSLGAYTSCHLSSTSHI